MAKMSISFNQSHKSSIAHNNRTNTHGNPDIDLNRLDENILYKAEPIEDKYHEIFDEAVQEYNQKQKRADRKIKDYYEKIRNDSKTHEQRELVVAIGKKEDSPDLIEHKKRILDMYAKAFEQRNPNLAVYNMVMHNDEANPHLHINYVPNFESKRGLGKRVGMDKALQQQGVEGSGMDLIKNWRKTETDYIQEIAEATIPEFDRATVESHKYMNVAEYKEYAREVDFLKIEKQVLERDVTELKMELSEERKALDEEKAAFESERAEIDVILRNKTALEQETDYLRAERDEEMEKLERIKKTTHDILTEDELPNLSTRPIYPPNGGFPTEIAVNLKDFRKLQEQAKKATSSHSQMVFFENEFVHASKRRRELDKKNKQLELEVEQLTEERDTWKNRFKDLQTNVNELFSSMKEKVGHVYANIFETGLTEVLAKAKIKRSERFENNQEDLAVKDLETTLSGHYEPRKVDSMVTEGLDRRKEEKERQQQAQREQYRRRQEMDWF